MKRQAKAPMLWALQPMGKTGAVLPLPVALNGYRELPRTTRNTGNQNPHHGPAAAEMRHNFAVRALEKPGLFKPQPYLYICVRCKHSFLVSERRGSIVAVDRAGQPLPEPDNSKRVATFAEGPCPGLSAMLRYAARDTVVLRMPSTFRKRLASILASLFGLRRGTGNLGSVANNNVHAPVAIMPQDLLS